MLAVSGELNRERRRHPGPAGDQPGGRPPAAAGDGHVRPAWQPSPRPEQRHRRSLYALKLRGLRDPFLEVFNQPTPEPSVRVPRRSTVTPQVFSLFNSRGDAATGRWRFAARLLQRDEATARRRSTGRSALAFGRPPTAAEAGRCLDALGGDDRPARGADVRDAEAAAGGRPRGGRGEHRREVPSPRCSSRPPTSSPTCTRPTCRAEIRGLMEVCLVLFNANEFVYSMDLTRMRRCHRRDELLFGLGASLGSVALLGAARRTTRRGAPCRGRSPRKPPHVPREGEGVHLPDDGGRPEPHRHLRPQAEARQSCT